MLKRSITLKGHHTSIALEEEFWTKLDSLATTAGRTLPELISDIDRRRLKSSPPPGLASALRVFVLKSLAKGD
ncbi:MAG: ribbon-helix-helix domain-containing protein [Marinicaulis sp.]|nr:ribbon-helix-helix domain-containing protein [Marinicaulis sp.]